MSNEHPQTPESPELKGPPKGATGGVEGQQTKTKAGALITSFTQQPDEEPEQLQQRFIDEMLVPVIEWTVLPDAKELVAEITAGLEQGIPEASQAKDWSARAVAIVDRTSRLLAEIQRSASRTLGSVGAFAMSEIAHHCPKFMHMVIAPTCDALAKELERGDTKAAENSRQIILQEIGGTGSHTAQARLEFLLEKYFITKNAFHDRFREASQSITSAGNFTRVKERLEFRIEEILRDVLKVEELAYKIEFATNIPEEQQTQDLIPRAGLVEETLSELIMNALKVMEETKKGSYLTVSIILRKDGSLLLKVNDDGPGIGDRDPEELFKSGKTTTQRFGGTGMGLTFLRENIQRHFGGILEAQKNEEVDGKPGMTFSCVLPPAEGWPQTGEA